MTDWIKTQLIKYRELIMYGIFGVGATVINIAVFTVLNRSIQINYLLSNVFAWIAAFIFAFVTNKLWVFESKSWRGNRVVKEMVDFFLVRFGTGVLDMVLIYVFIDVLSWDGVVSKIIDNIVVIIINYVASKFWIFARKENS